ncbi:MAG: glycerophosphodiester phosphodiesterase [Idiomarina sp.]|nr:glycerophosphodiester phosphodiesterase [Idiomarina sp.]
MLIIAHRGASAIAPENTLAAFQKALEAHADGIELDIYEVDGQIYVFHDRYLERLTAQPGRLQDLSQSQIATLRIFGQQAIPTLKETLVALAGQCLLNIELKGKVSHSLLLELLDFALRECNFTHEQLLVSSFNHHWLQRLKDARPQIRIGALTYNSLLDYAQCADTLQAYSIHVGVDFIEPELVVDAHARGIRVYVFTVDEAQDIAWLRDMGVDGIFTNHPQFARNVLEGLPVSQETRLWRY